MFPLNTIIAWSINIIMNKKYDNNNIIIASRAYFLQLLGFEWPSCFWAAASMPIVKTQVVVPSSVAPECLVESSASEWPRRRQLSVPSIGPVQGCPRREILQHGALLDGGEGLPQVARTIRVMEQ
jgi:hypothetical protein